MEGRCGKCSNCRDLERVKNTVLACCTSIKNGVYPSPDHADDGVVDLWNQELKRLHCLSPTNALEEGPTPTF